MRKPSIPHALARTATAAALAGAVMVPTLGNAPAFAADTASSTVTRPTASIVEVPGFYAGGTWQFYQSNGPGVATVNLTQDSSGRLYGSASSTGGGGIVGTVEEGLVRGKRIYFTIGWSNGHRGRYIGSLGFDRRLSGTTFDLTDPSSQATWFSPHVF